MYSNLLNFKGWLKYRPVKNTFFINLNNAKTLNTMQIKILKKN